MFLAHMAAVANHEGAPPAPSSALHVTRRGGLDPPSKARQSSAHIRTTENYKNRCENRSEILEVKKFSHFFRSDFIPSFWGPPAVGFSEVYLFSSLPKLQKWMTSWWWFQKCEI